MRKWLGEVESQHTPVKPGNESLGEIVLAAVMTLVAAALAHGIGWCVKKASESIGKMLNRTKKTAVSADKYTPEIIATPTTKYNTALYKLESYWNVRSDEAKKAILNKALGKQHKDLIDKLPTALLKNVESIVAAVLVSRKCEAGRAHNIINSAGFKKNPLEVAMAVESKISLDAIDRWTFAHEKNIHEKMWVEWLALSDRAIEIHDVITSAISDSAALEKKILANASAIEKLNDALDNYETKFEKYFYSNVDGVSIDVDVKYSKRFAGESDEAIRLFKYILSIKNQERIFEIEKHEAKKSRSGVERFNFDGNDELVKAAEGLSNKAAGFVDDYFATMYGIVYTGEVGVEYPYCNGIYELHKASEVIVPRYEELTVILESLFKATETIKTGNEYFNDEESRRVEETMSTEIQNGWIILPEEDQGVMPIVKPGTESLGITLLAVGAAIAAAVSVRKKFIDMKIKHKLKGEVEQYLSKLNSVDRNNQLKAKPFALMSTHRITDIDNLLRNLLKCGETVIGDLKTVSVMGEQGIMKSVRDLNEEMLERIEKNIVHVNSLRDQYHAIDDIPSEITIHEVLTNRAKLGSVLKNIARIEEHFANESTLIDKIDHIKDDLAHTPETANEVFSAALQSYSQFSKVFLSISDDINSHLDHIFKEIDRMFKKPGNESMDNVEPAVVENANNEPVWTESDTHCAWTDFDAYVEEDPKVSLGEDEGCIDLESMATAAKLEIERVGIETLGMSKTAFAACEALQPGIFQRLRYNQLSANPSRTGKTVALECLESAIDTLRTKSTATVQPVSVDPEVNPALENLQLNPITKVIPRTQWIVPGMESIDHQLNSKLFSRLTAAVAYMRASRDYSSKNFKKSGFSDAIFEETGMRINVELDSSDSPNAYVFIPEIDNNNSILQNVFRNFMTNDTLLDLKNAIGRSTVGLIDRATSRVGGAFSNIILKSCITKGLLTSKMFTDEEVAAVMMHECGHVYTFFERLVDTVSMNYAISAVTTRILNTEDKKIRVDLIHEYDAAFGIKVPDADVIAESKSGETIATRLITESVKQRRNAEGDYLYSARGFEFSSDQFCARHGGGRAAVTALDKMLKQFGEVSYHSWIYHVLKQIVMSIVIIAGIGVTVIFNPALLIVIMFILITSRPLEKTYDEPPARFARIRRELIDSLKDQDVPAEYRRRTLDDLATIDHVLSKIEYKRDLLEAIWVYLIPSGRKATAHQELQQTLERLANNDLVIAANKFKLLTEDLKNA